MVGVGLLVPVALQLQVENVIHGLLIGCLCVTLSCCRQKPNIYTCIATVCGHSILAVLGKGMLVHLHPLCIGCFLEAKQKRSLLYANQQHFACCTQLINSAHAAAEGVDTFLRQHQSSSQGVEQAQTNMHC